ncbi:3,4-dioxygenase subunit beta [Nocardioides sp. SOB77]|uniref:3,4-dioxygenase subunit beta n=1 Tax=Nocardioides oceani TaxID=3058369 RepID=A0ABT8FI79_9ACTN|nr:3,4-dioxygenase subunit beta [Nocardioides oceani]MDN4174409.1 3,4-dioxygenase subunit beta [Nocardioides oceani]
MSTQHSSADLEDHDLGLSSDLPRILGRRRLFGLAGGVGAAAALVACGADETTTELTSTGSRPTPPSGGPPAGGGAGGPGGAEGSDVDVAEGEIPEETAGPYPGDGSNGANVLTESGVVRSDLTTSFGSASRVAEGVPVTIRLRVQDLSGDDVSPLVGAAFYLWHCDRAGEYSMYSEAIAEENYLRGVQETDEDGRVEFTSIFPACYDGRWPHMHFEVYESLASATTYTNKLRTSQLALPEDVCREVYATDGYETSLDNLNRVALDTDMVFADGHSLQLAKVTGSVEEGYTISLNVPV